MNQLDLLLVGATGSFLVWTSILTICLVMEKRVISFHGIFIIFLANGSVCLEIYIV